MKKVVGILILSIISVFTTFAQTYRDMWHISEFSEFADTWLTWGDNGEGVYFLSHYRSLTYMSEDSLTIDTLICELEHDTVSCAKKDFKAVLKFFRGMGPEDEWVVESQRWYVLYFRNYDLYIGRKEKTVTFEVMPRQKEDRIN